MQKNPEAYQVSRDFLNEHGAFDYVNQGKAKAGDKVVFVKLKEY
jgi:hypothetical protein